MSKNISRTFFHLAVSLILVFVFTGGDCLTDNNPYRKIAPPRSVNIVLGETSGSQSSVRVSWVKSDDSDDTDFNGYSVGTYELNVSNQVVSQYRFNTIASDTSITISPVEKGKRYISYVTSLSKEKRNSDSVATKIYSGVYERTSKELSNNILRNSFGWNTNNGSDSVYSLNNNTTLFVDIVLNIQGTSIYFVSPNQFPPGSRATRMEMIGQGLSKFNDTELSEPLFLNPLLVEEDNVYLLRTQENFYIKLWVKDISISSGLPAEIKVTFDYKLQSIAGLLVL